MTDEVTIHLVVERTNYLRDTGTVISTVDLQIDVEVEREWSRGVNGLPWCESAVIIDLYSPDRTGDYVRVSPDFELTPTEIQHALDEARELAPTWSAEDFADDRSDLRD